MKDKTSYLSEVIKIFLFSRAFIFVIILATLSTTISPSSYSRPIYHPVFSFDTSKLSKDLNRIFSTADSGWYISIAKNGYSEREFDTTKQENWAFLPSLSFKHETTSFNQLTTILSQGC
jgi:hypothetical protein